MAQERGRLRGRLAGRYGLACGIMAALAACALLVGVTILYAAYQIAIRDSAGNAEKAYTTYGGMQTIGDVTLTDAN